MLEFFTKVNPGVLIVGIMVVSSLISMLVHYWHRSRKLELEASLKLEMIQRGMSAEEIERVLSASLGDGGRGSDAARLQTLNVPEQA